MNRVLMALMACMVSAPLAHATTVVNGEVLITQADAVAGSVTPGDAPGFPVTLSEPGSYRFASNLQVSTNVNGFNVTAPEVTIDLSGFRLSGGGVGAIGIQSSKRGLTVKDGTIRGFSLDGVRTSGQFLVVRDMVVADNARNGVAEDTSSNSFGFMRVSGSTIVRNGFGIVCYVACKVEGNNVSFNTATGIAISGEGGLVLGNNIVHNGQYGLQVVYLLLAIPNSAGFGNNVIFNNVAGQVAGAAVPLQPNACGPQAC